MVIAGYLSLIIHHTGQVISCTSLFHYYTTKGPNWSLMLKSNDSKGKFLWETMKLTCYLCAPPAGVFRALAVLQTPPAMLCDNVAEWMLRGIWAAELFTLQWKQQVVNIPLVVVCRFSDAGPHLNGFFIETVRESISLSGNISNIFTDVVAVAPAQGPTKGLSTWTHNSSLTWSHVQARRALITPGPL